MIAGAITPSGYSQRLPLRAARRSDGAGTRHGFKPLGGWRFGNTIDGCQAEFVLVPDAMTNLGCRCPTGLTDEQVLMCPDIMSTGFSGAGKRRREDRTTRSPVFAQGPIGLCATAGRPPHGAPRTVIARRHRSRSAVDGATPSVPITWSTSSASRSGRRRS